MGPIARSDQRYRLLVEAVTDVAIFMLDPDGHVLTWNAGARQVNGYEADEIIGRHFSVFYPESDRAAQLPQRALETAARLGRFESEGWRLTKAGARFWAHAVLVPIRSAEGVLLGFGKVTHDLTERRAAEEALRKSEEQFRLLVQGVTDYAIYMLGPDGMITNWNVGAERIKGYAPGEVIGSHFSRFYEPEARARGEPSRALATATREGRFESEGWRVRKDGSKFWASVVIDPIRDADNTIIGFAKVTRDVTEKEEARRELERSREALFQAQKLDAIGQLTGGVAHDFNNLLMVILSSLELIRRRVAGDAKLERLVDNAVAGARRGATLTQRMLAFARRQELAPVPVDVPALLQGMADLLERSLGPAIDFVCKFETELPPVLIDPNQLELAILNLAVNARDAMPAGGRVVIEGRSAEGVQRPGRFVCIAVSDNGQGMDESTRNRAVEPFFTTKGAGKGTGLGLAMVHGVAAQSGGELVLRSVLGVGTTAEIWLPVASGEVRGRVDQRRRKSRPAGACRSLVVLAVDDDNLVLEGTVAMLEEIGHQAIGASSALEALSLVRARPDIEVVVTDEVMPGMRGSELVEVLAAERPALAVIVASGFAQIGSTSIGTARGLNKPFDQDALGEAIAGAMTRTV